MKVLFLALAIAWGFCASLSININSVAEVSDSQEERPLAQHFYQEAFYIKTGYRFVASSHEFDRNRDVYEGILKNETFVASLRTTKEKHQQAGKFHVTGIQLSSKNNLVPRLDLSVEDMVDGTKLVFLRAENLENLAERIAAADEQLHVSLAQQSL